MTPRRASIGSSASSVGAHLAERVARLSVDPTQLVREGRLSGDVGQRLREVLRAIDETVLPRTLHLFFAGREIARLVAAHRHLVGIRLTATHGAIPAAPVPPAAFAGCLANLLRPQGVYTLTRSRSDVLGATGDRSLSADLLLRQIEKSPERSPLDSLTERLAPIVLATLDWSDRDSAPGFNGDRVWLATLTTLAERFRTTGPEAHPNARIARSGIEGLLLPLAIEMAIVLVRAGERGYAAILPRAQGFGALAGWQETLNGQGRTN